MRRQEVFVPIMVSDPMSFAAAFDSVRNKKGLKELGKRGGQAGHVITRLACCTKNRPTWEQGACQDAAAPGAATFLASSGRGLKSGGTGGRQELGLWLARPMRSDKTDTPHVAT